MAMSLRPIRPQQPARTLSRNFKPQTDWREEEKATILLVYLPGFVREQVRTTYDESQRSIRLQGEQRLPNNRMRRVDERYTVPESCEGSQMEAEFGRGILTVTLPKTKPAPEPKPKAPMPQETSGDLRTRKGEEEMVSATPVEKQRGGDINVDVAIPGKTTSEMKSLSQTAGEETSSKTTSSTKETEQAVSTSDSKKQIDERNVREESGKKKEKDETEKPVKIIESVQGKEREIEESAVPEIVVSEVEEKEKEKIIEIPEKDSKYAKVKGDVVSKAEEKEKEKIIELSGNDSKDAKVEIAVSKSKEKEKEKITEISSTDSKDAKVEIVVSKSEEKEKEKINYIPGNDSKDAKAKETAVSEAEEKEKSAEKSGDSGDAAASAKLSLNNHGNPLVNTTVATIVILGLGAYYFYSFRT
ncbi:hypothetical protein SLEP1_g5344 [Rubroshorea leprosula]|uniref:SHSP domain-containing protein n=1 Tax=Rubroshorea leprosula TaxID=152421 RepID=A0AAV5HRN3_9ROSI|nr:hypothetical protein SLEP1_g5344 [Rubroshorea leprosula]